MCVHHVQCMSIQYLREPLREKAVHGKCRRILLQPLCILLHLFFFFFLKGESNRQATDVEMRRRLIQPLCGKNSTCLCAALIERGNTPLFYIRFLPLVFLVFVSYIQCVYFVLFHPLLLLRLSRFDTTFPTENIRLT